MKIKDVFLPSLLISEVFYPQADKDERLAYLAEWAAQLDYYRGLEIGAVCGAARRRRVRQVKEKAKLCLTSWATRDLAERKLSPSSLDPSVRRQADARLRELLEMAAECGADNFCLVSGPDPGEEKREEAKEVFSETVLKLLERMEPYGGMRLMIEPLDRFAHKKGLIGPQEEALRFIRKIRGEYENIYFSWDSAHVALNGESLTDSIQANAPYIGQIHLANAVLDRKSELYGDWHMKIGAPGFLTEETGYDILNAAAGAALPGNLAHFVSVEVRGRGDEDLFLEEKRIREFLSGILEREALQK